MNKIQLGPWFFSFSVVPMIFLIVWLWNGSGSLDGVNTNATTPGEIVLLDDDFTGMPSGLLSTDQGAHTEYHFTEACRPIGNWQISSFYHDRESARAWKVFTHNQQRVLAQVTHYTNRFTHPMIVAGDSLWQNYRVELNLATPDTAQAGIAVRYQNSRCYYFVGVRQGNLIIKKVNHAHALYQPTETILASTVFEAPPTEFYQLMIEVEQDKIVVQLPNGEALTAKDPDFKKGKVALLADGPAYFSSIKVTCSEEESQAFNKRKLQVFNDESGLQQSNPAFKLYKKFSIQGFGVGRNLRFGDLNNDGVLDVLVGQVVHHGPQDAFTELSCLTAMTLDGEQLWRIGKPDSWKNHLTNDVAFQIHDLDGDGLTEVIYCQNQQIIVADGATGVIKYQVATPLSNLQVMDRLRALDPPDRILGDCIFFADFRGIGRDQDMLIKDRYKNYWVLNDKLELMWSGSCKTGHYPYAHDIDQDGKDELAIGYTLLDDDGTLLWTLDDQITDHADGIAIVPLKKDHLTILCAASDEGMFFTNLEGKILRHYYIGHAQNPIVANLRDDLPGLESLSINFWGNQGIINLYNSDGERYKEFEPVQHGSMCFPVNWNGSSEEFFLLSANVEQGGLYDGWGRRAVRFPDDGHPDLCNAVMDIMGDARDEIVVWDTKEVWVYTQDDNPKPQKVYQPVRSPLYNYSNYQTTVSLPPDYVK
ncbi:MAG: hypothetical protein IPL46_15600 [Saprospiraceae bacterium]|nr:hypothetical protein [Saprospiraceae bacterium]